MLDQDNDRWCDNCWDNPATRIHFRKDGRRVDLCTECEEAATRMNATALVRPDDYVVDEKWRGDKELPQ